MDSHQVLQLTSYFMAEKNPRIKKMAREVQRLQDRSEALDLVLRVMAEENNWARRVPLDSEWHTEYRTTNSLALDMLWKSGNRGATVDAHPHNFEKTLRAVKCVSNAFARDL